MTEACQARKEATNSAPLRRGLNGDVIELSASGSWTAINAAGLSRTMENSSIDLVPRSKTNIDVAGVGELDTFGAWLLERLRRGIENAGGEAHLTRVPERYGPLLFNMHRFNRNADV